MHAQAAGIFKAEHNKARACVHHHFERGVVDFGACEKVAVVIRFDLHAAPFGLLEICGLLGRCVLRCRSCVRVGLLFLQKCRHISLIDGGAGFFHITRQQIGANLANIIRHALIA